MAKYKVQPHKFSLCFDSETSGYSYPNYAEKHQMISFGAAVVNNDTLEIVDTIYKEIKFDNKKYLWDKGAEEVHGLSIEYLEQNGCSMEEATVDLLNLIVKYWGVDNKVMIMGHNPQFDIAFLKASFEPIGLMFPIYHRIIDSSSSGFVNMNLTTSDEIFDFMGFKQRDAHNALEDVIMTVEALRNMRLIFNNGLK